MSPIPVTYRAPAAREPGPPAVPAQSRSRIVETRFGTLEFDLANAIEMPRGMPGFPDERRYGLGPLPAAGGGEFLLYQSVDNGAVSFIVLPCPPDGGLIEAADLRAGFASLGIAPEDSAALLIVAVRRTAAGTEVAANLRAPLLLDTRRRLAWQHVLANARYDVRQVISVVPRRREGAG